MGKPKKTQHGQGPGAAVEEIARVVYVRKEHAKTAKGLLKKGKFLDNRFRMLPATASLLDYVNASDFDSTTTAASFIAIPIVEEFDEKEICFGDGCYKDDSGSNGETSHVGSALPSSPVFIGVGYQACPYSTKMLDAKDDRSGDSIDDDNGDIEILYDDFWRRLALAHNSPRVVRRGGIDPNSKIRESGHRILWPKTHNIASNDWIAGPQAPSWIRVTEQGIKQSFDLTKVMFSRGNISEKIRFGKQLVREGDVILDLYAGIGYYTLPAVVHGKASKIYACEWNKNAVDALRFNIRDNKIEDKVEVFVGDCRESVKTNNIINMVDRVSLGLLPSSEGGWRAAIRALKAPAGGWLHVHANVPASEMESWTLWLCHRLYVLVREENRPNNWQVICNHVERVKSFAPTVFHYVADVFVGIPTSDASDPIGNDFLHETDGVTCKAWMRKSSNQTWIPALEETVVTPSCALSPDGVLSQEWMR
eukprot:jgi/Psemu1/324610/estExt_fgenesh1_pg.C_1630001